MAIPIKQLKDSEGNKFYPQLGKGQGSDAIELTQAEYDQLTDEEKHNNMTYYITDASPSISTDSYSTSEVSTGSTWINGKIIYKKTVNFGALPNASAKSVAHGATGITMITKIEAVMYKGTSSWAIPYAYVGIVSVEGPSVTIRTEMDLSTYNAVVTFYYTKD